MDAKAKEILENVRLFQRGEKGGMVEVTGNEPVRDNYAVLPKPGSALGSMPVDAVLKPLRAAFPLCVFTMVARAPKGCAAEAKKTDKDDK